MAERAGVLIGEGRCRLRLRRAGAPDEAGCPTHIEVTAGPFAGAVTHDTVASYPRFLDELRRLAESCEGTARLASREGFELTLACEEGESVEVKVALASGHEAPISLTFEFAIEAEALAAIIAAVEGEFAPS